MGEGRTGDDAPSPWIDFAKDVLTSCLFEGCLSLAFPALLLVIVPVFYWLW